MLGNGLVGRACIALLFMGAVGSTLADVNEFKAQDGQIKTKISAGKQNRIEISKNPIIEVIGNTAQYSIIANPNADYLYLVPQVRAGNKIDLSIIYGDLRVVELSLTVEEGGGETIRISDNESSLESLRSTKPQELVEEIADIMRHMVLSKKGKYHIEEVNRDITTPKTGDIVLSYSARYNYAEAELIGRRVSVLNRSNHQVNIAVKEFEHLFENVIAISSDREFLNKGQRGSIYLVSKVDEWNKE